MNIPLDEVIYFDAITTHPSTGAATDADSTPTFAVYEEATDTDIGVGGNLTKRTSLTGNYRGTFTLSAANGFEVGKWYSVIVSATVNSIAGKAAVKNFRVVAAENTTGVTVVDTVRVAGTAQTAGDLAALLATLATYVDTEVAAIKAKTDNLPASPAAVGSAMTLANNAITTAAINDGAITDAKFTVPSVTGVETGFMARLMQLWRKFFKKSTLTSTQLKTYADDGTTVVTTQTVSDDGTTQTQGAAS